MASKPLVNTLGEKADYKILQDFRNRIIFGFYSIMYFKPLWFLADITNLGVKNMAKCYCIDCGREIIHTGRCLPCNKKAKERVEAQKKYMDKQKEGE